MLPLAGFNPYASDSDPNDDDEELVPTVSPPNGMKPDAKELEPDGTNPDAKELVPDVKELVPDSDGEEVPEVSVNDRLPDVRDGADIVLVPDELEPDVRLSGLLGVSPDAVFVCVLEYWLFRKAAK